MTATREQVIALAADQVGTTERPPGSNRTKYGAWFGLDGYPWCAQFVCWVFAHAGDGRLPFVRSAYTPTIAQWFIDAHRWTRRPQRGDLAFFNFPDSLNRIQHIGIVTDVEGRTVRTIEGNTSAGDSGSQDNGGGVFRRTRSSYIVGYGRPAFGDGKNKPKGRRVTPKQRATLERGDKGSDVRVLQRDLNHARPGNPDHWPQVQVDGIFGKATHHAVVAFQRHHGLEVDGRMGKYGLDKLERVAGR